MKKAFAILLVLSLALTGLAGCGTQTEEAGSLPDAGEETPIVLKIATTVTEDSPGGVALTDYFKPYIEEHSEGKMIVEVYANGVLGGDRQAYEALQLGTLEASAGPLSVLANFDPKFAVVDLPFLFNNKEEAYAALDGDFGDMIKEDLPQKGMRVLSYCENAFRNLSNSKKPIESMADLEGMKIRVMEAPVYISMFKAFGANPTPVSFNELYTALQQGTVDGQDNGIVITYTSKLHEIQEYYTITGHSYAAAAIVVSENFWQSLSPELQKVLQDGALYYGDHERRLITEAEEECLKEMEAFGVKINELSAEAKKEFKDATVSVLDEMAPIIGDDELIEAARAIQAQ